MTNEKLTNAISEYEKTRELAAKQVKAILEEAFKNRDSYDIPEFLWGSLDESECGSPATVWCDYRHDGAFVDVWSLSIYRYKESSGVDYRVSGKESMEYASDYVSDVSTYEYSNLIYFIEWFVKGGWDEKLNALYNIVNGSESADVIEAGVNEWFESECLCFEDVDIEDVVKWAKNYKIQ